MSFETELTRVAEGAKGTLKSLITKLGGTVADEKIDGYPELAEAIEFENIEFEEGQPKITVSGILKGDGEGNITAAVAGEDYLDASYTPTVVKETNQGLDQKFWRGTKEEFDAVETKSDDTLYIVTDDSSGATVDPSSYMPSAYLATLSASSWNADTLTQTVTVPGILADESKQMIIPAPTIACMSAYNDAGIQLTNQAANALTFTAQEAPTEDIQVYVSFQNVNLVTG